MEQISKCEYSSLSCFLQLENLDTDKKRTTPKDSIFQDVSVLKLYYDILCKVEKDPFKYWNISALRNYLWYFYKLSKYMSGSFSGLSELPKYVHKSTPLNIYTKADFAIFFTGLYSKDRNACIEGLFIVCQRQADNNIDRRVMTYSELLKSDLKKCLDDLTVMSTVEKYFHLLNVAPEKIEKIEELSEIDKNTTYDKNKKGKYIDTRLHILIDGVDNIPLDYFRILYGICSDKHDKQVDLNIKKRIVLESVQKGTNEFKHYQEAMIDAINKAILSAEEYKFNHLPLNFYSNNSKGLENPFQYLLPIDFTGTGNPDFCACISVDTSGTGRLKTILNIRNEVYGNVRVFGKDAVESVKDWWV